MCTAPYACTVLLSPLQSSEAPPEGARIVIYWQSDYCLEHTEYKEWVKASFHQSAHTNIFPTTRTRMDENGEL